MVAAPPSPDRPAEALDSAQDFVPRLCAGTVRLPRLGILSGRDDHICAPVRDGVAAAAGVVGAVGGDRGNRLTLRDLTKQVGQHGRITNAAAGDLDCADLNVRRGNAPPGPFLILLTLVHGQMNLAPHPPARTTVLARRPFALSADLDAGAVRCPAGSCEA